MERLRQRLLNGISYFAVDAACSKDHDELIHRAMLEYIRTDPSKASRWLRRMGAIGPNQAVRSAGA